MHMPSSGTSTSLTSLSSRVIQGLCYTPPTTGTIRTGHADVEATSDGAVRLPTMDDEFTLTTDVKDASGRWVPHPMDAALRRRYGEAAPSDDGASLKLRSIPVRLVFDLPDLNLSEQFTAFAEDGTVICSGDGASAARRSDDGSVTAETCVGAMHCQFGRLNGCGLLMRMLVQVEGQAETSPPFILRSSSVHATIENRATLEYWHALFGGRLAGLRFHLKLKLRQSTAAPNAAFYYARLEPAFDTVAEGERALRTPSSGGASAGAGACHRAAAEERLLTLRNNSAVPNRLGRPIRPSDTSVSSSDGDIRLDARQRQEDEESIAGGAIVTAGAAARTAVARLRALHESA